MRYLAVKPGTRRFLFGSLHKRSYGSMRHSSHNFAPNLLFAPFRVACTQNGGEHPPRATPHAKSDGDPLPRLLPAQDLHHRIIHDFNLPRIESHLNALPPSPPQCRYSHGQSVPRTSPPPEAPVPSMSRSPRPESQNERFHSTLSRIPA